MKTNHNSNASKPGGPSAEWRGRGRVGHGSTDRVASRPKSLRTELYFAAGAVGASDLLWQAFLKNVVTRRFPKGLTVLNAYGQWRCPPLTPQLSADAAKGIVEEQTRLLVLVHEASREANRRIEQVRKLWRELTGEESVLRLTMPVECRF